MFKIASYKLKVQHIYYIILLVVVLSSMYAWFFWSLNRNIVSLVLTALTICIILVKPNMFLFSQKQIGTLIVLLLFARFISVRGDIFMYLFAFINSLNIILFFFLKKEYKEEAILFLSKSMGIIIGISLFAWIIFIIGVKLPFFPDTFGFSEERNEALYFFNNHYFFLFNTRRIYMDNFFPRFSSIILEPGYLGSILVILLFINKFNLKKKYNIVFLVALIFTFSLAGWLLGLLSYIIVALKNSKNKIIIVSTIIITIFLINWVFTNYKNGNNAINWLILERLKYDSDTETVAGYNRTVVDFDEWFKHSFITSSDILLGSDYYKNSFAHSRNVGWKPYMAQYGLIGVFLYLLYLFYWYYKNKNFLTFGFILLYIGIFIRGHHEIFWAVFPILYMSGCTLLSSDYENK